MLKVSGNTQYAIRNTHPDLTLLDLSPALEAEIGRLVYEMLRQELRLERQKRAGDWSQPALRR